MMPLAFKLSERLEVTTDDDTLLLKLPGLSVGIDLGVETLRAAVCTAEIMAKADSEERARIAEMLADFLINEEK